MSDHIILKGSLEFYGRGIGQEHVWRRRHCILYGRSHLQEARFDFYESEADSRSPGQHSHHRSFYLQQIQNVAVINDLNRKHVFQIHMKDPSIGDNHLFCAPTEPLLHQWVDAFSALLVAAAPTPDPESHTFCRSLSGSGGGSPESDERLYAMSNDYETYEAEVVETEASLRCQLAGTYELRLHPLNICLLRGTAEKYVWPYRHIRRYGRSRTTFTFEAGRKCLSGEGLLTFKVPDGSEVFAKVTKRTKAMKEREDCGEFNFDSLGKSTESLEMPSSPTPTPAPAPPKPKPKPVPKPRSGSDATSLPQVPVSPMPKPKPPKLKPLQKSPPDITSPKFTSPPSNAPPLPQSMPPPLRGSPKATGTGYDQPDSGFNTMDSDLMLPKVLKRQQSSSDYGDGDYEGYSRPQDYECVEDCADYSEPYETHQPASMSKLVTSMNISSKGTRHHQPDAYDHIDLRHASNRPPSQSNRVETEESEEHLYGDLSICKTDTDDGYCSVQATK